MREPVPDETRRQVEAAGGYRCQASTYGFGSTVPCTPGLQIHHRRLRSQGGTHSPTNLVVLCPGHHREVHDNPARGYACGLLVRAGGVV